MTWMCCGCGRSHVLNARHFLPFLVPWRIVRLHPLLPFFKQLCLESSIRQLEFQKEQIQPWRHPYQHLLCSLVATLVSANQPHPHNSTVESDQSSIFPNLNWWSGSQKSHLVFVNEHCSHTFNEVRPSRSPNAQSKFNFHHPFYLRNHPCFYFANFGHKMNSFPEESKRRKIVILQMVAKTRVDKLSNPQRMADSKPQLETQFCNLGWWLDLWKVSCF